MEDELSAKTYTLVELHNGYQRNQPSSSAIALLFIAM